MLKKKFLSKFAKLLAAVFTITVISAASSKAYDMTLNDAISYALDKSSQTKSSLITIQKAGAAVNEALGNAYPTVDFSAGYTRYIDKPQIPFIDFSAMLTDATYNVLFDENLIPRDNSKLKPIGTSMMSMSQNNNYNAQIQVSQVLFSSAVFKGIGASKIYLDLSEEQMRSQAIETVTNIRKAFYGVILAKENLTILKESYDNANENLNTLRSNFKMGLASEYDVMQVEVQVENIKPQIKQLENTITSTTNTLKVLMGMDLNEDVNFVGQLSSDISEISNENDVINEAYNNNYQLRLLNKSIDVDKALLEVNKSNYYPTVAAFGSYTFAGMSDNFDFNNYRQSMVGLNVSMNLYNGKRTKYKLDQTNCDLETTKEQIALLKSSLESQIKAQVLEIQRVKATIEAQQQNIKLAEKTYSIARSRFDQGTGTQLEIKNADLEVRSAKTNLLQSAFQYDTAIAQLDYLTGNLKADYLQIINKKIDDLNINKKKK